MQHQNQQMCDMRKDNNKTLTRAEMQVMTILWNMGKAADVHEVVEHYDEPQPAYTTVSTYMKILTTKGFVDYKKGAGKQYLYFPVISRAEYTTRVMRDVKNNFFGGSATSLLRFFVESEQIDEEEIRELLDLVNHQ